MTGRKMMLAALLAAMMTASAGAMAEYAVVYNGSDPESKLNLRSEPNTSAPVVGQFYTGTQVEIVSDAGDGWSLVTLGKSAVVGGYMMTQYLRTGEAAEAVIDCAQQCEVVSPYGTQSVVLRSREADSYDAVAMLPVGMIVRATGTTENEYYFVEAGEEVGCLEAAELR